MVFICPVLFIVWKLVHKTKMYKPSEVDLHKNIPEIEEYHRTFVPSPPKYVPPFCDSDENHTVPILSYMV